jgi:hypothetical protein
MVCRLRIWGSGVRISSGAPTTPEHDKAAAAAAYHSLSGACSGGKGWADGGWMVRLRQRQVVISLFVVQGMEAVAARAPRPP